MDKLKDLKVWVESYKLSVLVYRITRSFPKEEMFGITSQLRRASSSVGANITEGKGRSSEKALLQFLLIARGSLFETNYFLDLSRDLDYLSNQSYEEIKKSIDTTGKMLNGLLRSIKNKNNLNKEELSLT